MPASAYEHLHALVVEDNVHMRTLLRSLLHALGIKNVSEAADGDAGLREMRNHTPDLILTDLSMVPTDGIAFTRQVRTAANSPNPYVPIIMVTGHTERPRVEAARDAGVTEFLAKPITVNSLIARLAEIVEKVRQVDQLVGEVSTASSEQSQGVKQIGSAITQMDRIVQSNAASAEEGASAAEELNAQSLALQEAIGDLVKLAGSRGVTGTAPSKESSPAPDDGEVAGPSAIVPRSTPLLAAPRRRSAEPALVG